MITRGQASAAPVGARPFLWAALHSLWSLTFWVQILVLLLTVFASVPFGKFLDLSVARCPRL